MPAASASALKGEARRVAIAPNGAKVPKVRSTIGIVDACAAMLMPIGPTIHFFHQQEPWKPRGRAAATMPAVAANERRNETSHGAPGSPAIERRAAKASVFQPSSGRSTRRPAASTLAMIRARRSEIGSEATAPKAQRRRTVRTGTARRGATSESGAEKTQ